MVLTDNKCLLICLAAVIIIFILFSINRGQNKSEHYFPIPNYYDVYQYKDIKAKEWSPYWFYDSEYKAPAYVSKWNPLWDSDNIYHPQVPQITHYKPNSHQLPHRKSHISPDRIIYKDLPEHKIITAAPIPIGRSESMVYDMNNPNNNPI
jgi:hypothetical protein